MNTHRESFNPNDVAKDIASEALLLFSAGQFFRYEKGVYRSVSDYQIKATIKERLGDFNKIRSNEEVFQSLRLDINREPDELNIGQSILLNIKNGMLNIETMVLSDHDPKLFSTTQLDVEYNAGATCPLFEKTVAEWLETEKKVQLLQEFLGYCIERETKQEKILFMVGSGANGKSTLLSVIEAIFGSNNCSAIPLDKLSDKFSLAQLFGKALNLASEAPSKSVLCDDKLKAIVSGDLIQAEKKFQPPFSFRPFARFIVACNEIPRTEDQSNAFYRRMLILPFSRTYSEQEQDKTLKHKLMAEKDGIFLWMLAGLRRLKDRGRFEEPKESVVEREAYRKENNTVMTFVEEECELSTTGMTPKNEFFTHYSVWCQHAGYKPMTKQRVGKSLKEHYSLGDTLTGPADSRTRVWTGIALRSVQSVQTFSHQ